MSHSLCNRCSIQSACSLNYDGEPCRKERDVEPTCFDVIMDMDVEELADFLSEWHEDRKVWKGDGGMVEAFLNDPPDRMPRRYRRAETEREAILRLTMCARRNCQICKFGPRKPTVRIPQHCQDRITENMNILAQAFDGEDKEEQR